MNKRKNIEAALAELGIRTEAELNNAIQKMKPINLSLMAETGQRQRKAG